MVHTAVVLPRELLERLKKTAEAAGQGLSTEIRLMLQVADFLRTSQDRKTLRLLTGIRSLSEKLERNVGKGWHEDAYAYRAFSAGVLDYLARQKPSGEGNKRPDTAPEAPDDDPPEAVGRTLARLFPLSDEDLDDEDLYRNLVENSSSDM
jgi:hypothetical protein